MKLAPVVIGPISILKLSQLHGEYTALSSQPSALSPQLWALSPQFSALSSQLSALSSQLSALSPQLSALSSQLWAAVFSATVAIKHNSHLSTSQVSICTPGWREASTVKCLAQGHKRQDSNLHSDDSASPCARPLGHGTPQWTKTMQFVHQHHHFNEFHSTSKKLSKSCFKLIKMHFLTKKYKITI